jgi:hypothetical protein
MEVAFEGVIKIRFAVLFGMLSALVNTSIWQHGVDSGPKEFRGASEHFEHFSLYNRL